jgi:hypothetical protein
MRRWIGVLVCVIALGHLSAQQEMPLPQADDGEPIPIEPPMLIPMRAPDGSIPDLRDSAADAPANLDIAKLEKELSRAEKRAESADRLFKAGIIAKMDAEQRVLKAVQLTAALAEARLQAAKAQATEAEQPIAETALADVEAAAKRAAEERHRAEIEQALRDLQRQQKLLALGSGRKADVSRAEKKLAELQSAE